MRFKIPIKIIELEPDNYHVLVTSQFSDGEIGNWIIDTGASRTVFNKKLNEYYTSLEGETDEIHTAGIGDEPQEISLGLLENLIIGKLSVKDIKVALLDLSHINKIYSRSINIEICGLIGGDFLMKNKAVIDYKKQVLILNN